MDREIFIKAFTNMLKLLISEWDIPKKKNVPPFEGIN